MAQVERSKGNQGDITSPEDLQKTQIVNIVQKISDETRTLSTATDLSAHDIHLTDET